MDSQKISSKRALSAFLALILLMSIFITSGNNLNGAVGYEKIYSTGERPEAFGTLLDTYRRFIVVRHKQLGGSHYAYTDLLSDEKDTVHNNESTDNFNSSARGAQMVMLELYVHPITGYVERKETVLLETVNGIIRDPDVSPDGTRVLYSYKANPDDDCHLYEMNLETREIRQITFGSGVSDIEPKYLPGGKIIFNSSRCIQTVDCWVTPVMNLYICDADGSNIQRVGYDQVHTTYPTVTEDGRVIYTRWDYNDRTQMYIQGIFQMQPDGRNQTELWGNNSNFPTTLLHTRSIPGYPGYFVTIASGHHNHQIGKLAIIDISKGRNNKTPDGKLTDAFQYVFTSSAEGNLPKTAENRDTDNTTNSRIYKYPIALNLHEFLVSYYPGSYQGRNTQFGIYYMNSKTNKRILLCEGSTTYGGASQIVPIKERVLFDSPNLVDHSKKTGTYYIGNIYEGDGLKGVPKGEARYLRIVALEYRVAAIGATIGRGSGTSDPYTPVATGNGSWDIKRVLGIVDIEPDGSALFEAPANVPLYFQVLNEDGELIQSMRSWSTLMPEENFSCVGCHEDKNTVPPLNAKYTMAMARGVQKIRPDLWMDSDPEYYDAARDSEGFSYMKNVQPILDKSCVSCHNNVSLAENLIGKTVSNDSGITPDATVLLPLNSSFKYRTNNPNNSNWMKPSYNDSSWSTGKAPFGTPGTPPGDAINTYWNTNQLYLRTTINVPAEIANNKNKYNFYIRITYDESPTLYLNGVQVYSASGWTTNYVDQRLSSAFRENLVAGTNYIAMSCTQSGGGQLINFALYAVPSDGTIDDGPVSLEGIMVEGPRERIYYPLSYLVLTASKLEGNQFLGNPVNKYTNWISAMSRPEMLAPYEHGSTKSYIIQLLKNDPVHKNLLTKKEIQTIAAWIDLAVPLKGSYDELINWNAHEMKEYEAKRNKRQMFDTIDYVNKRITTGIYDSDKKDIKIEYLNNSGTVIKSITQKGIARLTLDNKFTPGYKVRVTLPQGYEYLFFNLHERLSEALIYCPGGVYEYTIPSSTMMSAVFPSFIRDTIHPTITARIPTEDELKQRRNLAVNPYAGTGQTSSSYPHAVASQTYISSGEYEARNAIDGFKNNLGHGSFPVQSWGHVLNPSSDMYFRINFGATVYVDSVGITIRADFSHDTYYTDVTLQFSDGSTQKVKLQKTEKTQYITLAQPVKTSYVILKDFKLAENKWAALTEVEVFGTVMQPDPVPLTGISLPSEMSLIAGESKRLTVSFIPPNTTDPKTVIWSSSNTAVATVDAEGNVKGIKQGTAVITAKVGNFTKTCTVTVLGTVPSKLTSSSFNINDTDLYIGKISAGTSVDDLLAGINEREYVKVYKGSSEIKGSTKIATGMTVAIMDGSSIKKSYTIVITGDVNGDGQIDIADMMQLKSYTLKLTSLSSARLKAADVNGDNKADIADFLGLKAHTLKIKSITPR